MIKNAVFDMGNVLVAYDENRTCRQFMEEGTEEEGLQRMKNRLSREREKELAEQCFRHWHEFCMWTVEGTDQIIRELKEKGYGVYLCSNASVRLLKCYRDYIPAVDCFDGILFSAEEKLLKPQKEIYLRLFEKFGLKPEECFFVDDQPINIEGAAACGMKGCCHKKVDAETLREELAFLL